MTLTSRPLSRCVGRTRGALALTLLAFAAIAVASALVSPGVAHAANLGVTQPADVVNGNITSPAALIAADGGDGISLREAVTAVEAAGGANVIAIWPATYVLTGGDLNIGTKPGSALTIQGGGVVVQSAGMGRVFDIDPSGAGGANVVIRDLTVRNGNAVDGWGGGAIVMGGSLGLADTVTIQDCVFSSNTAPAVGPFGGAVMCYDNTRLQIDRTTFNTNSAAGGQGGAVAYINAASAGGLYLYDCTFTGNAASGGGAVYASAGSMPAEIKRNIFTGNSAADGGALLAGQAVTIESNRIVGNTASVAGGGLYAFAGGVVARHNWWGSNGGPGSAGSDTAAGSTSFDITQPMVLAVRSDDTTVARNATTVVRADMTRDASGNVQPAPPGSPAITWNAAVGSMSPAGGSIAAGLANSTFTAAAVGGRGWATGRVDSQTATTWIDVPEPSAVTTNPANRTVLAGQVASFTVAGSGYPTPTVQWQRSVDGGTSFSNIAGATSASYALTTTVGDWGNRYRAVFTNMAGVATSTAAVLTVNTTPTVTSQPASITVIAGTSASFTASAAGTPAPTVRWQRSTNGGASYADVPGATSPTYSFTASAADYGNRYRAVFTNAAGVATSTVAVLTVHTVPTVLSPPSDVTVLAGQSASFTASAEGTPVPTVRWQRSTDGGTSFTDIPGATSVTYSFTTAVADHGNRYRAVFTNAAGVTTSTSALLTVQTVPAMTVQPSPKAVLLGNSVSFTASAEGTPSPSVQWQVSWDGGGTYWDLWGETGTTLWFMPGLTDDGYLYRAVFANGAGVAYSDPAQLTVRMLPEIWASPHDTTVLEGQMAAFTADAVGYLPPSIQWQVSTDGGATFGDIPGATGGEYDIVAFRPDDGKMFRFVVTNDVGTATSTAAVLTVHTPPVVTLDPAGVTARTGTVATFTASAEGTPAPAVRWQVSTDGGASFADIPGATAREYAFSVANADDAHRFRAVFSSAAGVATSTPAALTVLSPPDIFTSAEATFTIGTAGTFTVEAANDLPTAALSVSGTLPSGVTFTDAGDGTGSLSGTPAAGTAGDHTLSFTATNGVDPQAVQTFVLHVVESPAFTSADSVTFTVGKAGSFTAEAAGNPVPALSLSGALPQGVTFTDNGDGTASLAGTPADGKGGVYPLTLQAANGIAPDATQSFTLTVDEAPHVLGATPNTTVTAGFPAMASSALFHAAPAATVEWQVSADGGASWSPLPPVGPVVDTHPAPLPPRYVSVLSYPDPLPSMNGNLFRAVITNAVGAATSTPTRLVVEYPPSIVTTAHAAFLAGTHGSFTVATSANPTASISTAGSLPPGVTLTDNGDGTASIEGTPPVGSGRVYAFWLKAQNSVTDTSQLFLLTVNQRPTFTSAESTTFVAGTVGAFSVTATGFPLPALSVQGTLPQGVTLFDHRDSTASFGGFVTRADAGVYPLTFTADNGATTPTVQTFTLYVGAAPVVTAQPAARTTRAWQLASFSASASGEPAPSVQWQLDSGGGWVDILDATSPQLVTTATVEMSGWRYRAVFTNALGTAVSDPASLRVDGAVPVTTLTRVPGAWASGDVTFTLDATDTPSGTGVADTRYILDSMYEYPYTGEVTVSKEGTTVVSYWSVDAIGNVEPFRTDTIGIDRTPPRTTCDAPSTHKGSLLVTFSAEDTASGVARTSYQLDGGAWLDGGSVDVVTNGAHTLQFRSTDAVGNAEGAHTATFTITTDYIPIAGTDRYGTAVAASRAAFPEGASTVIVGTGENWPDAITGSALAGAARCPLLLTRTHSLPATVAAEIRRLGATRAFVLGRTPSVDVAVAAAIEGIVGAGNVTRLGGVDRYETSAMIASATVGALAEGQQAFDGVAFVTSGADFPDSLAVSPIAWYKVRPILLSRSTTLPPAAVDAIARLGVDEAVVIGDASAVGSGVYDRLSADLGGRVTRLEGPNRYATGVEVAKYGVGQGLIWDGAALATGRAFPDALAGGVMQGKFRSVVLLTRPTSLDPGVKALLEAHAAEITHLRFLGGTGSLAESVRADAVTAIGF